MKYSIILVGILASPAFAQEHVEAESLELARTFSRCAAAYNIVSTVGELSSDMPQQNIYRNAAVGAEQTAKFFALAAGRSNQFVSQIYKERKTYWLADRRSNDKMIEDFKAELEFCASKMPVQEYVTKELEKASKSKEPKE